MYDESHAGDIGAYIDSDRDGDDVFFHDLITFVEEFTSMCTPRDIASYLYLFAKFKDPLSKIIADAKKTLKHPKIQLESL